MTFTDNQPDSSGWGGSGQTDINSIDVDSLVSEDGNVIPESSRQAAPAAEPAKQETTPAQTAAAAELAFKWKDKEIRTRLDDPRATQWLSQGYDYSQRMAEFNQQQAAFKAQQEQIRALEERYKPVEEFYEKNPHLWEKIQAQYQTQGLGDDPNNPVVQKLSQYEQKLQKVEQFIQSQEQQAKAIQQQQEDQALDGEISKVREAYSTLDWNTPDQSGLNLELRVLKHAQERGISDFEAAFFHLMKEPLIKMEREKAMADAVKERQKNTKLGLLDKSPTPKKALTSTDHRNKTIDQLFNEGFAEINAG